MKVTRKSSRLLSSWERCGRIVDTRCSSVGMEIGPRGYLLSFHAERSSRVKIVYGVRVCVMVV